MTSRPRGEQIAELYRCEASRIHHATSRHANAPAHVIDDACAHAWELLLTRDHVELSPPWRIRGWLTTVATRQAWRWLATDRDIPSGGFSPGDGVLPGTLPELADPNASDPADLDPQDPVQRALQADKRLIVPPDLDESGAELGQTATEGHAGACLHEGDTVSAYLAGY